MLEKKKAKKIDSVQPAEEAENSGHQRSHAHEPQMSVLLDDLKTNWVDITRKMKLNTN